MFIWLILLLVSPLRAELLEGLRVLGAKHFVEEVERANLAEELDAKDFAIVLAFNDQAWENFKREKDEQFRKTLENDSEEVANLLRHHWLDHDQGIDAHIGDYITTTNNHSLAILVDRDNNSTLAGSRVTNVVVVRNGVLYIIDRVLFPTTSTSTSSSSSSEMLSSSQLEVETKQGRVRGVQLASDHVAWLSIPYAKPPLGELRFRAPENVDAWEGVLDVSAPPAACMQARDESFGEFEGTDTWNPNTDISEDCLYISVHKAPTTKTEEDKEKAELLPVLVWIYGGGFMTGSSALDIYNPRQFVNRGQLVFVTLQYRVGVHGFLSMGEESGAPGNVGMLDQVRALEWVTENIGGFGGDASSVTLMGESAGAQSSSGLNTRWGFVDGQVALRRGQKMAESVGCSEAEDVVKCLRDVDAQLLVNNEYSVEEYTVNLYTFVPTVDGIFLDDDMDALVERLANVKKPVLIGTNANEGFWSLMYFLTDVYPNQELSDQQKNMSKEEYEQNVKAIFPFYSDAVNRLIAHEHENLFPSTDPDRYFKTLDQIVARSDFVCSTEALASAVSSSGNSAVYRYHFEHQSSIDVWPSWSGSKHGDELEFVFGSPLNNASMYVDDEIDLAADLLVYWTNFVVNGDPNGHSKLRAWPRYSAPQWPYLNLTASANAGIVQQRSMRDQCQFWNQIIPLFAAQ